MSFVCLCWHRYSFCLLLFLVLARPSFAAPGVFENLYDTAPPPDEGPPGSAGASRDRSLLPYQIGGLVGAYVGVVVIANILLCTVGRRMRRSAQTSPQTLQIEMVKSPNHAMEATPVSPSSTTKTWIRSVLRKGTSSNASQSSSNPGSPGVTSVVSFDRVVIESHKETRQAEMERLYAAVMDHDAKRQADVHCAPETAEIHLDDQPGDGQRQTNVPARLDTQKSNGTRLIPPGGQQILQSPTSPVSPVSPRSPVRAIYPPDSPRAIRGDAAVNPASPVRAKYPASQPQSPPPNGEEKSATGMPSSPRHWLSRKSRTSSIGSASSKFSRRALHISSPIANANDDDDEARTPLTPRNYDPPPPPTPPTHSATSTSPSTTDSDWAFEGRDKPQPLPLPRPAPQRAGSHPSQSLSGVVAANKSAHNLNSSLPLRALTDEATVDAQNPSTKTTYVERRDRYAPGTTPRTGGVPATPYSAYMPFTPITPVTPHLVSRKERKIMEKSNGRRVIDHNDLVKSDADLWSNGY